MKGNNNNKGFIARVGKEGGSWKRRRKEIQGWMTWTVGVNYCQEKETRGLLRDGSLVDIVFTDPLRSTLDARRLRSGWGCWEDSRQVRWKLLRGRRVRLRKSTSGGSTRRVIKWNPSFLPYLWQRLYILIDPGHYFDGWVLKDECVSDCRTPRTYVINWNL